MDTRGLRVMLACGLGGFVGGFIATQSSLMIVLGVLVGAFTSYLVVDLPHVWRAMKHQWKKMTDWSWDPPSKDVVSRTLWAWFANFQWFASFNGLFFIGFGLIFESTDSGQVNYLQMLIFGVLLAGTITSFWSLMDGTKDNSVSFIYPAGHMTSAKQIRKHIVRHNFIAYSTYWLVRGLIWLIPKVPAILRWFAEQFVKGATFIIAFVVGVIISIHSNLRTTCWFGGAMGTLIAAMFGAPLAGLVGGVIVGAISYYTLARHIKSTDFSDII